MKTRSLQTTQVVWLLVILLALAACGRVTNDAPTALEPQLLILTVTQPGDSGPGTLRRAIELADPESTITFQPDLSGQTITLASELLIGKNLTIIGPEGGITISGNNSVRVMRVNSGVTLNLDGLTIANGRANWGGGIYNFGTLTVTNSTILGNSATWGGGIDNGGTLIVTNSTFSGNSANNGGGISNGGIFGLSTLTVTNSTFSGNSASEDGGGIYSFGTLTVTNSTFSGNSANNGGGITDLGWGELTFTNSIVALNTAATNPDIRGSFSGSHNLIGVDPKLGSLADNGGPTKTMALLAGSPAIDAALLSSCPATDQRGVVRPQGSGCDIGAFELDEDLTLPTEYTLTVDKAGEGSGTVTSDLAGIDCGENCVADFVEDTEVTLTAMSADGSVFSAWGGDCEGATGDTCTLVMNGDKSVTATFELEVLTPPEHTLTVVKTGDGTVTSNPEGIDCGDDCSEAYSEGTTVILTATASPGSTFAGWSGCDSTSANQCTVTMNSAKDVTATFAEEEAVSVTLNINQNGTVNRTTGVANLSGTVSCSAPTTVSLKIELSQEQRQRGITLTVVGSEDITLNCSGQRAWAAAVTATNGVFVNGDVQATASVIGSDPVNQATRTVRLQWLK